MNPTIETNEFLTAMKSLKRAKNFFSLLIILALLVQAAGFIVLYTCDAHPVVDEINNYMKSPANMELCNQARCWQNVLIWGFMVSKLVAVLSAVLLVLIIGYTGVVALVGGGKGVQYFVSAFLWSLLVLALLSPWQEILRGGLFSGALYNLQELRVCMQNIDLLRAGGEKPGIIEQTRFFARFLGYPLVSFMVLITMLVRYARGYRQLAQQQKVSKPATSAPQI